MPAHQAGSQAGGDRDAAGLQLTDDDLATIEGNA
jgi:hypothetical protein